MSAYPAPVHGESLSADRALAHGAGPRPWTEAEATRSRRAVLLAALLLGIAHLFLLPAWMGEDEPWHFEYVQHVSEGHLPLGKGQMWTAADLADAARLSDDRNPIELLQEQSLAEARERLRTGG